MTRVRRRGPRPPLAVDLHGYGNVGRALLPLLPKNRIAVATIRNSKGVRASRPAAGTRVFVDATSPRYEGEDAEAWVARLEDALAGGTPVVTCNKAPLATDWTRLARAAREGETTISCSATVGGGTPVLLFLGRLEQSHGIEHLEATLSTTLGYVLHRVAVGASLSNAVRGAQRAGWAEPDPTLDLDGTDAYAKAVIIHNLLFSKKRPITLDANRPRLRLVESRIRHLARSGIVPQGVASVSPGHVGLALDGQGFEANGNGVGRVSVRAVLRDGSEAWLAGPGAGPRTTASAILGDLLALREFDGRGTRGVLP